MNAPSTPRPPSRLFLHLLPGLILAAIATGLFWWHPVGGIPQHAYFEVVMRSDTAGQALLLPDIDGTGLHKELTLTRPVPGGGQPVHVRFEIPAGHLLAFVFTPLDRAGEVAIERCWISSETGVPLADIPLAALHRPASGPGAAPPDGALYLRTTVGDAITGLQFDPSPPLDLAETPPPPPENLAAVFLLALLTCTALSLALEKRLGGLRTLLARAAAWCELRPRRALLAAALAAVSLSCWPVIFQGKSFVSPDNGMLLLYSNNPTVPGAAGGRVENAVGSDIGATLYWHLPVSMIQARAIFQDHELPLWSRYNSGGLTLLGQGISMLGDPLHWLTIATGGAAWAWDVKFVASKILFALGIGLLVWRTSRHLAVALALTVSAPFIGFFAYRFCHAGFFALCAAPWILLAWVEAAHAATVRRAARWAGLLILANWWELNSGTAKEASAFLVFLNVTGGLGLLLARESAGWRARRLALMAWATVIFLLLSAPLWLVFLDALGKAYTVYDRQEIGQLQPGLAIGLFDDIFQRQFMDNEFLFTPSANFFVLLGAAWAAVRVRALVRERWFVAALAVAVAAAAVAYGVVPQAALGALPFIRTIYHFDNTFSCVLFILLFVLAGFGLREAATRFRQAEWTGDWALVLTLVAVLGAGFLGMTEASHRTGISLIKMGHPIAKSGFFWGYTALLVLALALLPWAVRTVARRAPGTPAWAAIAVCAFVALHFRHGMWGETKFDLYTMNPKARVDFRHLPSPAADLIHRTATEPGRVMGLDWEMVPGFNTVLGFETISGPDALMNPAYVTLANLLRIPRSWEWRMMAWRTDFPRLHRALDFLNVRYFLAKSGEADLPGTTTLGRLDLTVAENPTAWPRAFFTDAVLPYADGEALHRLIEEGDGRPFAAMPSGDRSRPHLPPVEPAARAVVPARNYRLTNNTTAFEIDAPAPGLAVLQETNSPGDFEVFVDGRRAQCLTVNHAFRGVQIERAGHHTVRFAYWPEVLTRALWLGVAGVVSLLVSAGLLLRRRPAVAGTIPADADVREPISTNP